MTQSLENILLSHGGGGRMTRDLINEFFLPNFDNAALRKMGDSAVLDIPGGRLAFTTDTFVVQPIFFPGADIGHLSVCGTVNDLAVMGAKPVALAAGFVIEEGFPLSDLAKIIKSMKDTAAEAGVSIVTGDTKVVEKGSADGIFINTSGVGLISEGFLRDEEPCDGDKIIINGPLGDHGIAVMAVRENLPVESDIVSDAAPLNSLIFSVLEKFPRRVKFMRDATRGGFATVLNEVVEGKKVGIDVFEDRVPVRESVAALSDMLGLDPLYIANEGKVVMIVDGESAEDICNFMRRDPLGVQSAVVGQVTSQHGGRVVLQTFIGGGRILDMLLGDQLPRIC